MKGSSVLLLVLLGALLPPAALAQRRPNRDVASTLDVCGAVKTSGCNL